VSFYVNENADKASGAPIRTPLQEHAAIPQSFYSWCT